MDRLDRELRNLGLANKPALLIGSMVSDRVRSDFAADIVLMLFLPSFVAATNAGDRAAAQLELTRTAAALAAYRATRRQYPKELADLLPEYVDTIALDLYSGKPFLYKRRGDGYLLYSVFENGADDQGTDFEGRIVHGAWVSDEPIAQDRDQSDLVVLLPRAKMRLSKHPNSIEGSSQPVPTITSAR